MRTLTICLAVAAEILLCAIYVAAKSPRHARTEIALAEANGQAEETRQEAAQRIAKLEAENANLNQKLENATASLDQQAKKLAAADQEVLRSRDDLDTAWTLLAELSQGPVDERVKKTEDSTAGVRDADPKAKLDADKTGVAAAGIKAPPAQVAGADAGNDRRGQKNGRNNNGGLRRGRGSVASLPRTCPSFSELDTNHDGRLTLAEYKVGFPDAENVEEEFKALDTNHDGTLSIDEYKAGHPDPPVVRVRRSKKN
jgi:hypothetical protein